MINWWINFYSTSLRLIKVSNWCSTYDVEESRLPNSYLLLFIFLIQACVKVCGYVRKQVEKIRNSMDGKNVDTVLMEFGVRFHRLIYEHLQQYSYSCMGGMLAICDVAEYRKCAKDFKVSLSWGGSDDCKSSLGRKSFEDADG